MLPPGQAWQSHLRSTGEFEHEIQNTSAGRRWPHACELVCGRLRGVLLLQLQLQLWLYLRQLMCASSRLMAQLDLSSASKVSRWNTR